MKPHEKLQEQLSDHQWETYLLARKLHAWAVLIEAQTETELEGLGMSLREYSDVIYGVSRSLDEIQLELEPKAGRFGRPKRRKTA